MSYSLDEREITPRARRVETPIVDTTFSPDSFISEMCAVQNAMGTDNKRLRCLSHALAVTVGELFVNKHPPAHTAEWLKVIEQKYGMRLIMSLIKYLDEILDAARPIATGIACNTVGYLFEIDVENMPAPNYGPTIVYKGRNNDFVNDAIALTEVLRRADSDPEIEGIHLIEEASATVAEECTRTVQDCLSTLPRAQNLFLIPHKIKHALLTERPSSEKTKDSSEDTQSSSEEPKSNNNHTKWRRSLTDVLAQIQYMIDMQNKNGWSLSPSAALNIPETVDQETRDYIDENLNIASLKGFLRGDLFNREIRRKVKAALPATNTELHPAKKTAEGVVDRMIARHMTNELTNLFSNPKPHNAANKPSFYDLELSLFTQNILHLLELLGSGIGRTVGRTISPIEQDDETIETILDIKYEGQTFDVRTLPYIEIANELIGTISLVKDMRELLSVVKPMEPLSSVHQHAMTPGLHEVVSFNNPSERFGITSPDGSQDTTFSTVPKRVSIKLAQSSSTHDAPNPVNIEDFAF